MQRRKYISAVGMALITGCSALPRSNSSRQNKSTSELTETTHVQTETKTTTPTATKTTTETETPAATGTATDPTKANLEVMQSRLIERQSDSGTEASVVVVAKNTGQSAAVMPEINVRFFDSGGTAIMSNRATISTLRSDESWKVILDSGFNSKEIVDTIAETNSREEQTFQTSNSAKISRSSLSVSDSEAIVSGVVKNVGNKSLSMVEPVAHYYLEKNLITATNSKQVNDLPSGETWQFKISYEGNLASQVSSYRLVVRSRGNR